MDAGMVSADVIMMAEPSDIADAIGCDVATAEEIYNAARTNLSKSAS
jgi:hypothetical protein